VGDASQHEDEEEMGGESGRLIVIKEGAEPVPSPPPFVPRHAFPPSPPPSPVLRQSEVAPFHQYYAAPHWSTTPTTTAPTTTTAGGKNFSDCFPPPLSFPPFPFGHESPTDKRKFQRLEKRLAKMTFKACAMEAALRAQLRIEKKRDDEEEREMEAAAAVLVEMEKRGKAAAPSSSWWPWHVQTSDDM
jgi:hypothetical protein